MHLCVILREINKDETLIMEHVDCLLDTDYSDYYDGGFGATSNSQQILINRKLSMRPVPQAQLSMLKSAGLNTPFHGTLKQVIEHTMELSNGLCDYPEWMNAMDAVVFDSKGNPERISLSLASKADPAQFSTVYIPTSPSGNGKVLRYVQIGTSFIWLFVSSNNDWRAGKGDASFVAAEKHYRVPMGAIKPEILRHFDDAVFSIDFIWSAGEMLAIEYNNAPHLGKMGLESVFDVKQVCDAVFARMSAFNLPDCQVPLDLTQG
tara:strand:+ start:38189 stop:38977 length:789 start_codon:yes stop_codon:yes gene_type:complete